MNRARKVYRPSGTPTYKGGGKTKEYSKKGYEKVQKEGSLKTKAFTKHQFPGWIIELIGSAMDVGLDIWQYTDQQAALSDLLEDVEDPLDVAQDVTQLISQVPQIAPSVSTQFQERKEEIKGMPTDVDIDTSAFEELRESGEQETADVVKQMSKGGTKSFTALGDVLESAEKRDIGIAEKEIGVETTETQLEEAAKKSQQEQLTQLSSQLGAQEYDVSSDISDIYTDELASAAAFEQAIQLGQAGLSLPGTIAPSIGNLFEGLAKEGAKVAKYEDGGDNEEVMGAGDADISPGEEEHETNPIDLVRDGKKIGEMTGGEVIMPSKDVGVLEQLLAEGDSEGVMKLMGVLMMKWNKKSQEYAEKEIGGIEEAKGGAKIAYRPSAKINY